FPQRKKPRRFSYTPYYYKEEKEGEENNNKLKFKRGSRYSQKKRSHIWIIILIILVLFVVFYLKKI
ncbi:MAG: hypothetical protein V1709_08845, partial [Planctomycetota bacterium]